MGVAKCQQEAASSGQVYCLAAHKSGGTPVDLCCLQKFGDNTDNSNQDRTTSNNFSFFGITNSSDFKYNNEKTF